MTRLALAVLAALLPAGAASAAPRCSNGASPALTGDAFSPASCSPATKPAPPLPGAPAAAVPGMKTDLRDLDGSWEGSLAHAMGRYSAALTLKTSWSGKTAVTLDLAELQFHERVSDALALTPAKERGAYEAVLTSTLAPGASLKGTARLGVFLAPEASTATARISLRQADLVFANGAAHRIAFELKSKDELEVTAASSIPGAPPQKVRLTFTRAKKKP